MRHHAATENHQIRLVSPGYVDDRTRDPLCRGIYQPGGLWLCTVVRPLQARQSFAPERSCGLHDDPTSRQRFQAPVQAAHTPSSPWAIINDEHSGVRHASGLDRLQPTTPHHAKPDTRAESKVGKFAGRIRHRPPFGISGGFDVRGKHDTQVHVLLQLSREPIPLEIGKTDTARDSFLIGFQHRGHAQADRLGLVRLITLLQLDDRLVDPFV